MLFTLISIGLGCAAGYGLSYVVGRRSRLLSYWIVGVLGFFLVTVISIALATTSGLNPVGSPGASGAFFVVGLGVMAWTIGLSRPKSDGEEEPRKLGISAWIVVGTIVGVAAVFSLGYFSRSIVDGSEPPAKEARASGATNESKLTAQSYPAELDWALHEALRKAAGDSPSFANRLEAEVWLTDMSARLEDQVGDPEERIELLTLVHMEAARVELPPELILAIIDVESNFDRYAVSVDGSLGLMQIMPYWIDEIGRPDDNLLHTPTNLRYGCTILRFYYDLENGDLRRALGRYDGSLGQTKYPNKVIGKIKTKWFQG